MTTRSTIAITIPATLAEAVVFLARINSQTESEMWCWLATHDFNAAAMLREIACDLRRPVAIRGRAAVLCAMLADF